MQLIRSVVVLVSLSLFTLPAYANIFEGYPDVIVCEFKADEIGAVGLLAYYAHARFAAGHIEYRPLINAAGLQVSKSGVVSAPRVDDCNGKDIEYLFRNGRAFYLTRFEQARNP